MLDELLVLSQSYLEKKNRSFRRYFIENTDLSHRKYANWSIELKSIYDTFTELKVFASGSSVLEIHKGSHDLSRRALVYELYDLSLREYLQLKFNIKLAPLELAQIIDPHEHVAASMQCLSYLAEQKIKILPELKQYFINGFYPFFEELPVTAHFAMALEQNIHVTLESG